MTIANRVRRFWMRVRQRWNDTRPGCRASGLYHCFCGSWFSVNGTAADYARYRAEVDAHRATCPDAIEWERLCKQMRDASKRMRDEYRRHDESF